MNNGIDKISTHSINAWNVAAAAVTFFGPIVITGAVIGTSLVNMAFKGNEASTVKKNAAPVEKTAPAMQQMDQNKTGVFDSVSEEKSAAPYAAPAAKPAVK